MPTLIHAYSNLGLPYSDIAGELNSCVDDRDPRAGHFRDWSYLDLWSFCLITSHFSVHDSHFGSLCLITSD